VELGDSLLWSILSRYGLLTIKQTLQISDFFKGDPVPSMIFWSNFQIKMSNSTNEKFLLASDSMSNQKLIKFGVKS